jgi:Tfp pilus assembly protein PilN
MRKTEVDKWINNFKEKGFIPLNLTFGPFPIQHILSQVNIYTDNITFDGHLIERNTQSEWLDYKYTETASAEYTLKIESEVINEKLVIPYAAAFQLILSNKLDLIQANVLSLDETFRNFVAGRKNKAMIFFMLILFFILLLVNFFIFSELNTNNITLSQNLAQSSQDITDINEVSNQIKGKESLLTELGWDGNANKSKMIDQLAALLPNDVHWQVTEINPLESSKLNNLKGLHFLTNTIKVTGESERIISVNEWLARIKNKWWIKDVELESYNYNNESKSGRFVAIISYK